MASARNAWDHDPLLAVHTRKKLAFHLWSLAVKASVTNILLLLLCQDTKHDKIKHSL